MQILPLIYVFSVLADSKQTEAGDKGECGGGRQTESHFRNGLINTIDGTDREVCVCVWRGGWSCSGALRVN